MILQLAVALVTSILALGSLLVALWWFDRCDQEPVHLVFFAVLLGGSAAPLANLLLAVASRWRGPDDVVTGLLLLPVASEILKAAGVVMLGRRIDGPADGLVLGCAAGLGWAVAAQVCPGPGGSLALFGEIGRVTAGLVVATGAGFSAVASGAFGGMLGLSRLALRRRVGALWQLVGLLLAVGLHCGWVSAQQALAALHAGPGVWLALALAVVGAGVALVATLLRLEGRVLAEELAEEAEWQVVPEWVLEVIPAYCRRVQPDWWPDRGARVVIARLLSRLALRKRALRRLPEDKARLAALEVGRLRKRLHAMLLPENEDGTEL